MNLASTTFPSVKMVMRLDIFVRAMMTRRPMSRFWIALHLREHLLRLNLEWLLAQFYLYSQLINLEKMKDNLCRRMDPSQRNPLSTHHRQGSRMTTALCHLQA